MAATGINKEGMSLFFTLYYAPLFGIKVGSFKSEKLHNFSHE